jgi:hypothetical protein
VPCRERWSVPKEGHAATACWQKMGKPEWANQMAQPGLRWVAELEEQVKKLTGKLAAVQASFASMAGEPSRDDSLGCWVKESGGVWGVGRGRGGFAGSRASAKCVRQSTTVHVYT